MRRGRQPRLWSILLLSQLRPESFFYVSTFLRPSAEETSILGSKLSIKPAAEPGCDSTILCVSTYKDCFGVLCPDSESMNNDHLARGNSVLAGLRGTMRRDTLSCRATKA